MLPYINQPFEYVSSKVGSPADEVKMISLFLLSFPLAGVLKRLPDNQPIYKNIFNISVAIFYLVGLFDLWSGLATIVFDAVGTYLIAAYIKGPYMPWVGFVFLMSHMSVSHIYRMYAASASTVDITGAQMVLVMKLSAFCWNVWDGQQKIADLSDVQKERAIKKLPSPLDYAGFVAFFPSIMIGPAFDYVDYERWITTSMFDLPPGMDPLKAPPTRKKRRIPRSGTPAILKMATGLIWLLAFLILSGYHNPKVVLSDRYAKMNFLLKIYHLHMMNFVERMKYYAAWTLTEGACILAGIGYKGVDPKTGKPNWDRLTNIKPAGVELAQNSHAYLGNWNINTNHWLRNYIYLRVTPKGKKPGFRASMATFVTSAFWHGFAPGYYLTFLLGGFIQNIAKQSRRLLRPFFMTPDGTRPLPTKRYYDAATWLLTQLAFSFTTTPFILLTVRDSNLVWSRVYYYAIIGLAIAHLFLASPGKALLTKRVKQRTGRPALSRNTSQESLQGATLGLPSDPSREWEEMVDEVLEELRRRQVVVGGGSGVNGEKGEVVNGPELRKLVEEKLEEKKREAAKVFGGEGKKEL